MSDSGLRNYAEMTGRCAPLVSAKQIGLSLSMIGLLLLGACASNGGGAPPVQKSQAQRDLRTNTDNLTEPLEGTVKEATLAGGILGTGISFSFGGGGIGGGTKKSAGIAIPLGMTAGNLAGRYVAAKQREYSEEVAVVEAITEDISGKNQHAERTIATMKVVVVEDRARLAELREAQAQGQVSKNTLEQQVALAEDDLTTMQQAVSGAEAHLATFTDARSIILKENKITDLPDGQEMRSMDNEIDVLRERIRAMKDLVDELASVS